MTIKQFYDAWDFKTMEDGFSVKLGETQSVLIYEGDDVLIGFLGDMVIKSIKRTGPISGCRPDFFGLVR